MKTPTYKYLLERVQALESLCAEALGPKFEAHRRAFDEHLPDPAAVQPGRPVGRPAQSLLHFEFSDTPPKVVSFKEAADLTGHTIGSIRTRIYSSANKACAFYKRGRWQVLAKSVGGADRELKAKFDESGNPDDLRELSPRGKF